MTRRKTLRGELQKDPNKAPGGALGGAPGGAPKRAEQSSGGSLHPEMPWPCCLQPGSAFQCRGRQPPQGGAVQVCGRKRVAQNRGQCQASSCKISVDVVLGPLLTSGASDGQQPVGHGFGLDRMLHQFGDNGLAQLCYPITERFGTCASRNVGG